ncbi:TonB-dependent receptor plug domain-containing protein [Chryseobacterium arachidis]|uniref:TonB-dependent receptor plug domain-containing protein n=1 Tax=Chryseobacterium arachidis TaxID=1416778 RepID=UPI00361B9756
MKKTIITLGLLVGATGLAFAQEKPKTGNTKDTIQANSGKTKDIDEVVIIAYGSQKKGEVTGAVGKVNTETFKDRPIARVDQALTGQIAGVKTRATSGKPGEPLEIRVRGTASISASNSPVYVVDGMVVDDMANISPDDVQSIDVLKDAASTAMYGSRGSNGVVIVTTKKKGLQGNQLLVFHNIMEFRRSRKNSISCPVQSGLILQPKPSTKGGRLWRLEI